MHCTLIVHLALLVQKGTKRDKKGSKRVKKGVKGIKGLKGLKGVKGQEVRLGPPLPRAPVVRMTGV